MTTMEDTGFLKPRGLPMAATAARGELDDATSAELNGLREAMLVFMDTSERDTMPAQYITTFILVATRPGLSVREYAELARVSSSVMSRHLLDIGERNRHMGAGFGLVTSRANPMELRKHEYFLTPRGKSLADRMGRVLKLGRR